VVHGPTPRSYDQRTPKKMKAAALRGALSDRARAGLVHVVDGLVEGEQPSTKAAIASLAGLITRDRGRTLVVLERGDDLTWLSLRNVHTVHLLAADQLNTYDVLLCDDVVFTKAAFDAFVSSAAPRSATAAEPASDASTDVSAHASTDVEPDVTTDVTTDVSTDENSQEEGA
jgi:large subunit ribosomal protein L4